MHIGKTVDGVDWCDRRRISVAIGAVVRGSIGAIAVLLPSLLAPPSEGLDWCNRRPIAVAIGAVIGVVNWCPIAIAFGAVYFEVLVVDGRSCFKLRQSLQTLLSLDGDFGVGA